jgi:transcriptional regulator with XRE-family HTH domain
MICPHCKYKLDVEYYDNHLQSIGYKLRYLIEREGITQLELADAMGICKSTLHHYITNKRKPDIHTLAKMASYLSSDLNFFDPLMNVVYSCEEYYRIDTEMRE